MSKVIVVGGGPAGMMGAIAAAEAGGKVILVEQNDRLGKKLFITGKGRCNLTNGCEAEDFFSNVVTNHKFLYSAFYQFDNHSVMRFFEESGCRLKEERGMRIFPVSDRSSDVIGALKRRLDRNDVEVVLKTPVKSILTKSDVDGTMSVAGVMTEGGRPIHGEQILVATGGMSYPLTGSTGAGHRFARKTGHTVTEVFPALVPFEIREEWCKALQGLSLKNVTVSLKKGEKTIFTGFGEMLFTHFGVSGPLILSASSAYQSRNGQGHAKAVTLCVDLKPALSLEQLDRRLLREFESGYNKQFKNMLAGLLPAKLRPVILSLSGLTEDKKVHEITREERHKLAALLKNLCMTVSGVRDFSEAIITRGGVSVREINPSTMESKKVRGLFFAGEILDVDGLTGGFNLQIAWSTGFLAGSSMRGLK